MTKETARIEFDESFEQKHFHDIGRELLLKGTHAGTQFGVQPNVGAHLDPRKVSKDFRDSYHRSDYREIAKLVEAKIDLPLEQALPKQEGFLRKFGLFKSKIEKKPSNPTLENSKKPKL